MDFLRDFLESGQKRTKKLNDTLEYYTPPAMRQILGLAGEINPVNDIYQAGANMRDGDYVGAATNTAAALMPVAGAVAAKPLAKGMVQGTQNATDAITDALMMYRAGGTNAAKQFASSEDGGVRLWHGSPHDFDRFSTKEIGAGSGGQVHGNGIYFSDKSSNAAEYASGISSKSVEQLASDGIPESIVDNIRWYSNRGYAPEDALKDIAANNPEYLDAVSARINSPGGLYEVDFDAATDMLIDADLPINEQSKGVREALKQAGINDTSSAKARTMIQGNEDALSRAGVKGLKYNAGDSTEYVAFNDRDLNILSKNGERTPQGEAQTVLDLLKAGSADQVTDDMLAKSDDMYLFNNYDLPMDEASRLARADEMGFTTGRNRSDPIAEIRKEQNPHLVHYTNKDFQAFKVPERGNRQAIWATPDPSLNLATKDNWRSFDEDGVVGVPIKARMTNRVSPFEFRMNGEPMTPGFPSVVTSEDLAKAKSVGADHAEQGVEFAIFDPANIRSRFARFDPRLKHLTNLSAGVGGLTLANVLNQPQDEREAKLRDYLQ